jgi:hypothetical protein
MACSTKAHKDKVNLVPETLYVKHSRNGHARLDPSLPTFLLPDDVSVADMLLKEHSLEVWTAHFKSLKDADVSNKRGFSVSPEDLGSPWEEVEVTSLDSFQAASRGFKTPKKLKLGAVLAPEALPASCTDA